MDGLDRELAAARQERSDAGAAASRQLMDLQVQLREVDAARQAEQLALKEELVRAKVPSCQGVQARLMLPAVQHSWTPRHELSPRLPLMCCSPWWTPLSKGCANGRQRQRHNYSALPRAAPRHWRLLNTGCVPQSAATSCSECRHCRFPQLAAA